MERAPLPPHERPWRHPSELGPTRLDVDAGSHSRVALLAGGTLAVVLVAAFVVVMTPRHSTNPSALSATTTPGISQSVSALASDRSVSSVRTVGSTKIGAINAIPNAIAAVPNAAAPIGLINDVSPAVLPDLTDVVLVVTEKYAYAVPWSEVALLSLGDDAVVLAADGSVVARLADGRLMMSADAKVGSAIAMSDD